MANVTTQITFFTQFILQSLFYHILCIIKSKCWVTSAIYNTFI